jgi:hypothetical protein
MQFVGMLGPRLIGVFSKYYGLAQSKWEKSPSRPLKSTAFLAVRRSNFWDSLREGVILSKCLRPIPMKGRQKRTGGRSFIEIGRLFCLKGNFFTVEDIQI